MNHLRTTLPLFLALAVTALTNPAALGQQVTQSYISPPAPRVGEYYNVVVTVRNNTGQTLSTTVTLTEWPSGDQLVSPRALSQVLGPGGSSTYSFRLYCGVPGGAVRYAVTAAPR
jgi:hypothetical protein